MNHAKLGHTAPQAAAGYVYQVRIALAGALRYVNSDPIIDIAIEKFDDVSFATQGTPIELLQTKHHLKKSGNLTDSSVDLWKTLWNWAKIVKIDPTLPGRTRFLLVTTAYAPTGSAASYLRSADSGGRDSDKAEAMLERAGACSTNKDLDEPFRAFKALTAKMRKALFSAIEVIDGAPLISDMDSVIEKRISSIAPRGKVALAREQLEGWWLARICSELQSETPASISIVEVEHKLDEIREGLSRDSLPFNMEYETPPAQELDALKEMCFVRQLRLVGIGMQRLHFAKRDFYLASEQRSYWARKNLIFDDEIGRFETDLIREWQPRFAQMCERLPDNCDQLALCDAGQQLYTWVENSARIPIRKMSSRFLNVGSYHILADELRVGWHRDFQAECGDSSNKV